MFKISSLRLERPTQLTLFDRPLGNHGHVRTLIGELTEEIVAKLLGAHRHKTDSACDYCPDLSIDLPDSPRVFIECKAAGKSRQTFIYKGRFEKDQEFSRSHPLLYCVLSHATDTLVPETVPDLEAFVVANLRALYLIPFFDLEEIVKERPLDKLNSGYGGSDPNVYGSGYRVNLTKLEDWKLIEWQNGSDRS